MPKAAETNAERVSGLVAKIEAEAYARGRADAMRELREVLTAGGGKSVGTKAPGRTPGRKPASPARRSRGRRAPKGSVPRFVERVLLAHPGSTAREIAGHAATDAERLIRLSSIRVELGKGRASGRYASDGRHWSFAGEAPPPAAEEAAPPDPAPATNQAADGDAADPGSEDGRQTLGLNL